MSRVTPNSPSEIPERFLHHGGPPGGFLHHAQEDAAIGVRQQDLVEDAKQPQNHWQETTRA